MIRTQIRRDSATSWESVNPILLSGEMGLDTTSKKFKIGDGVTAWNDLAYNKGGFDVNDISTVTSLQDADYTIVVQEESEVLVPKKTALSSLKTFLSGVFASLVHSHTASDVGAVPTTRTVNSKELSSDITLSTADVADSSDRRYITDAQGTILGNTSGTNSGDQSVFSTIVISGQNNVVADTTTDTLTLVAGTNITLTTDDTSDSVTITATGGGGDSFKTISVSGQSDVVADSSSDTLTLVAGPNISITTDASSDSITITGATSYITKNVVYADSPYTLVPSSYNLYFIDTTGGPISLVLPVTGSPVTVKWDAGASANSVTVTVQSSGTIDGVASYTFFYLKDSITIVNTSSGVWKII